jgi:hypothetical protein
MDPRFDHWLEDELSSGFDRMTASRIPEPRYRSVGSPLWPRRRLALLAGVPAALGMNVAVACAAAALAAGGATAALVATSHGSHGVPSGGAANSSSDKRSTSTSDGASTSASQTTNHGEAVTNAVASCKAALATRTSSPTPGPGSHGIGQCVEETASDRNGHASSTSESTAAHGGPPQTPPGDSGDRPQGQHSPPSH